MPKHAYARSVLFLVIGTLAISCVPAIDMASQNLEYLNWQDFWIILPIVAGIPTVVVAILCALFRKRLYIAATAFVANWSLMHHEAIASGLRSIEVENAEGAAILTVGVASLSVLVVLSLLPIRLTSSIIGAVGCAMFALSAGQLVVAMEPEDVFGPAMNPALAVDRSPLPPPPETEGKLPDIIYIVPDRYGNMESLRSGFGYENSDFLKALRRRGFAVAENSRANYPSTAYSLASSLNMQYLEPLFAELDGKIRRRRPLTELIDNSIVVERLKDHGYRYVHLGSWWGPTRENPEANVSIDTGFSYFGGEFGRAVTIKSGLARLLVPRITVKQWCEALDRKLAYLESVGGEERPTFAFVHLLAPHDPILKDAQGNCLPALRYPDHLPHVTWPAFQAAYAEYVRYLNGRLLEIFDRQRATNPNPIIFVLQADEGPYPKSLRESNLPDKDPFRWREASTFDLRVKFGILNAIYFNNFKRDSNILEISNTLSPVNNWRLIFSYLEEENYNLLANRNFVVSTDNGPFRSNEITLNLSGSH